MTKKYLKNTNKKIQQQPKCSICYEKIAKATIKCQHKFCIRCITRWSKKKQTCPLCREYFQTINYHNQQRVIKKDIYEPSLGLGRRFMIQPVIMPWNYIVYSWKMFFCFQGYQGSLPYIQPSMQNNTN